MTQPSSRRRYRDYLTEIAQRAKEGRTPTGGYHSSSDDSAKSKKPRSRNFRQLLVEFWKQLAGHRREVIFSLATLTVSTLLGLLPPAGTKLAIDHVLTDPPKPLPESLTRLFPDLTPMGLLVGIALGVCIVTLVRTAIHLWGRWYATKAVNLVQADIRRRVFSHALRLPLHRVQALKSGGATSLIREDAGGIAELIFNMMYNPWQAIIQLLGSLVVLLIVDWRLMVGGILLLPAVWLTHRTWIHRVRPLYKDIRSRRQQIDGNTTETFGGIRVVRTFARDKSESTRFILGTHLLARQQLMVWWSTRLIEIVWEVLIPLSSTALLVYGGYQILQHELSLGDLMMFLVYLTMLLGPIASIASSAMQFQNNLAGLDRVLDILSEEQEDAGNPGAADIAKEDVAGSIEFRNVNFKYPGTDRWVLEDISFTAPSGSMIALVGRSGAGKTTLCNLVSRFYAPTSGTILLDGRNLSDIRLEAYRRLLGVVEQDVFLFDGTVRENIAYGRRGATDAEIESAVQAAAADAFIAALPDKLDTRIGERGVKLSGGQRQRLAIARAILADPRILILDEATSNLDSESERQIQSGLTRLLEGRTAFAIAHRLSTITHADLILVVDNGRIVERGTHSELMARGGIYRNMVIIQTEG